MMQTNLNKRSIQLSIYALAALITLSVATYSCKNDNDPINTTPTQTITDVVTANTSFTLLKTAVARAGLTTTLAGTGPFTVFAPTDAAFQATPYNTVDAINAAPVATLNNILLYHVVSGTALSAATIPTGQTTVPTSVSGNTPFFVSKAGTAVSVNGARVTTADIPASNGIVHAIDKVLMPPTGTILAVAQADTSLSLLTAAAIRGGVVVTSALAGATPLTVFAPTNAAFRAAGFANAAAINAAPEATLTAVLSNHVVAPARAYSPTLASGPITTFGGGTVTLTVGSGNVITLLSKGNGTNAATITTADINATNGVIHKINRVLAP